MVLSRTVPVGYQKLKVTDVIGYERAPLACGEDEKIFIWRFPHPHLLGYCPIHSGFSSHRPEPVRTWHKVQTQTGPQFPRLKTRHPKPRGPIGLLGSRRSRRKLHLLQRGTAKKTIRVTERLRRFKMVISLTDYQLHRLAGRFDRRDEVARLALELRRL